MSDTLQATDRIQETLDTVDTIVDGLHTLVTAVAALERGTDASPDLASEREKRKLAVYVRRFEAAEQAPKRKRTRAAKPAVEAASLLGRLVWKEFADESGRPKVYQGQVASVSYAARDRPFAFGGGVTATVKYSVQYEDGDVEDMTHAELRRHLVD